MISSPVAVKRSTSHRFPDAEERGIIRRVRQMLDWAHTKNILGEDGGFFCCKLAETGETVLSFAIEIHSPESTERYQRIAEENAVRLLENPDHILSWQSRNWTEDGSGAILTQAYVLSFDGLPGAWSEALMLVLAARMNKTYPDRGYIAEEEALGMANLSGNAHYLYLLKEFPPRK